MNCTLVDRFNGFPLWQAPKRGFVCTKDKKPALSAPLSLPLWRVPRRLSISLSHARSLTFLITEAIAKRRRRDSLRSKRFRGSLARAICRALAPFSAQLKLRKSRSSKNPMETLATQAKSASFLGLSGGMLPQKISKSRRLEMPF